MAGISQSTIDDLFNDHPLIANLPDISNTANAANAAADSAIAQIATAQTTLQGNINAVDTKADNAIAQIAAVELNLAGLETELQGDIALVDQKANAAVSQGNANASTLNTVLTRMPEGNGQLAAQAAVQDEANARATGDAANATLIGQVQAALQNELGEKASAAAVTQVTARVEGLEQAGSGTNMLINAGFGNGLAPWSKMQQNSTWSPLTLNLGGNGAHPPGMNILGVECPGQTLTNSNEFCQILHSKIPGIPGQRYMASCYIANIGCSVRVYLMWHNASVWVGNNGSTIFTDDKPGGQSLDDWRRVSVIGVTPADAAYATLVVRFMGNGGANPKGWILRPMLEQVSQTQTEPSPWNTGGQETSARLLAEVQRTDALLARVPGGNGMLADQASLITEETARLTGDQASATALNSAKAQIASDIAAVQSTANAAVSQGSANATQLDVLGAQVGTTQAAAQQTSEALATLQDGAKARWGINVLARADGKKVIGGMQLGAAVDPDGQTRSEALFLVDTFAILTSLNGTLHMPFAVDGANNTVLLKNAMIANGAITTAKIGNGAITTAKIGEAAIVSGKISDAAITTAKINNGAITNVKIGTAAIDDAKVASLSAAKVTFGEMSGDRISVDTLNANRLNLQTIAPRLALINTAYVGTAHIDDAAVTNAKIVNATITTAKIANAAIETVKIKDGAITTAKVGDAAISSAKIANLSVSEGKIANAAVSNAKIKDAAISNAKIADAAITAAKIKDAEITTAKIKDGAITNVKIGTAAIDDAKVANLSADKITFGEMSGERIAVNSLNANRLDTDSLTVRFASVYSAFIYSANIHNGAIKNAHIENAAIDSAKIEDAAITSAKIGLAEIDTLCIAGNAVSVHGSMYVPNGYYPPGHAWGLTTIILNEPAWATVFLNIGESDDDYEQAIYPYMPNVDQVSLEVETGSAESTCVYGIRINGVIKMTKKQLSFVHYVYDTDNGAGFRYVFPPVTVMWQGWLQAGTNHIEMLVADLSNTNGNGWKYYPEASLLVLAHMR